MLLSTCKLATASCISKLPLMNLKPTSAPINTRKELMHYPVIHQQDEKSWSVHHEEQGTTAQDCQQGNHPKPALEQEKAKNPPFWNPSPKLPSRSPHYDRRWDHNEINTRKDRRQPSQWKCSAVVKELSQWKTNGILSRDPDQDPLAIHQYGLSGFKAHRYSVLHSWIGSVKVVCRSSDIRNGS